MGNIIKYSTTGVTNTISKGNFYLGVNSDTGGPTDITGFWNGIQPPLGGYTLYGNKNDAFGPSINVFNNDAELISFVNQRGGNVSTISEAINYFSSNDELMLVNKDYEPIVTDGLVLNLDASFTPSYSRTGTTWNDISGYGINGTLINGVGYNSSNGGSLTFDGVDDNIQVNTQNILGTFSNWSMDAWIKWENDGSQNWMIVVDQTTYNIYYKNIMVWLSSDLPNKRIAMYDGGWQFSNSTIPPNTWTYIGATTEGQVGKMYINGILDATRVFTWNNTNNVTNFLGIGGHSGNSGYRFNGNISITKIYNRTLTDQEILQNYEATKSRYVLYKNAYEIKQANPNSPSGIYTISNPGINGGAPTQIYADMETDGGGWTLIMTNSGYSGWTYENSISRNITSPSVVTNYSIIGYADALKRSSSGFQYMIDANTRGSWGGIWTANGLYSFTSPLNTNTNITLNTKFGTWIYEDSGIEERMPWYSNKATGAAFITTNGIGSGSWWGTLITDASNWGTAPWISNGMSNPSFIWYWVR